MTQGQNLLNRLSNVFTKDPNSLLGQMLQAVGIQLDSVDPVQTNLAAQFAISTCVGDALDRHGKDWGVTRKAGETDKEYRARIQAMLPIYTSGPTVATISSIVQNFTGTAPIIIEYGPQGFTMGVSPMGDFVFSSDDKFSFQVQTQNPEGLFYNQTELENAVNYAKPARSKAIFVHQGSTLNGRYLLDGKIALGG